MKLLARYVLFVGFAAVLTVVSAMAQDSEIKTIQLEDYLDFETVGNPQISPDGSQVIYSRRRVDKLNDRFSSSLWIMNADGSRNRQLMSGGSALWSPSGDRIAYVASDSNDKPQIFVRFMDDEGLVTQVTSFEHAPRSMAWSPDGQSIAFVARIPKRNDWTVSLPGRPKGAKWADDPVIIDTLHYRQDRVGFTNSGFDHLFVVPAIGGTPRQLTSGDWNVGARAIGAIAYPPALSWSPDSTTIAFDGPGKPVEAPHYFESHINLVDVDSGEMTTLTEGRGTYNAPVYSPDGSKIAFAGYPAHDTSYPVPNLYTIEPSGDGMMALAEELPDGPSAIHWAPNSREILFTMNAFGQRNIHKVNLRGRMSDVTSGKQVVTLSNRSENGALAVTVTRSDLPGTVAVIPAGSNSGAMRPLTNVNADIMTGKTLGRVAEINYSATASTGETADVQGWIVYPPDYEEGKTYPLLLSIHGGPHAMYNSGFNFTFQEFAARGYVVLYTNPRGSTGYGDAFVNAIRHRYPGALDYADLMAGVDYAVDNGIADPERLFITGCSGGGVLTTWTIGQTDRFKAAAALCPVVNWIGMSGTTDVVGWLYNFFPKPFWEDPKPWLDHSTIMHVGKVVTPTLLMTGDKDLRTPLGEAEEYYAALKIRGIDTLLVPMRGEYHGTRSIPSNYLRTSLMMRKWFDEYDPANADDETSEE